MTKQVIAASTWPSDEDQDGPLDNIYTSNLYPGSGQEDCALLADLTYEMPSVALAPSVGLQSEQTLRCQEIGVPKTDKIQATGFELKRRWSSLLHSQSFAALYSIAVQWLS